jgi:hypothetical protein
MSDAQEKRRAESWESQHKEGHEKEMAELREMKKQLDSMDPASDEYEALKAKYQDRYSAAEAFFMRYYEP